MPGNVNATAILILAAATFGGIAAIVLGGRLMRRREARTELPVVLRWTAAVLLVACGLGALFFAFVLGTCAFSNWHI